MALVLEGADAHNPLGMADDLVAQAAFEPSSVDISRFMPDVSEFRNEPDPCDDIEEAAELEPDSEPESEAGSAETSEPFSEPEFGFAARPEPEAEFRAAAFDEVEFPVEEVQVAVEAGLAAEEHAIVGLEAVEIEVAAADPAAEFRDDDQSAPSTWIVPDWATSEFAPGQSAIETGPAAAAELARDADETAISETADAWQDHGGDLPFATQSEPLPVRSQPASHSIRARIRATPNEEPVEAPREGLFAAIVRLFRRNRR
jgi:hypothetical protein